MRFRLIVGIMAAACGCGGNPPQEPRHPSPSSDSEPIQEDEPETRGETQAWSEVEPLTADSRRAPSRRTGTVVVTSDPERHGEQINMLFSVNGVRIEGIFAVPGGRSYRFNLPAGSVEFGSKECSLGNQGFELMPGEVIPIGCSLGNDGDCCEVRIPVEGKEQNENTAGDPSDQAP